MTVIRERDLVLVQKDLLRICARALEKTDEIGLSADLNGALMGLGDFWTDLKKKAGGVPDDDLRGSAS